jgi:hypothetical protein
MSPAPWQYDINKDRSRALIVDAEGFTIAYVTRTGPTDITEDLELMTAAPDMLDALMDFVSYFGHDNDNGLDEILTNARAAINKATYTQRASA